MIYKAIKFADAKHESQVRKGSQKPYVTHPVRASYMLVRFKRSKHLEELIIASILHDTLEDTDTNFEELAREFSPLVASLVLELTSDEEQIKLMGKNEYLKKKMVGISSYALVIKLIDRLDNVSDHPKRKYIEDTIDLVQHISKRRKLTRPHKEIIKEIIEKCDEYQKINVDII